MARGTRIVIGKMQDRYVEARLDGNSKEASAKIAGYAPTTKESQIEKPGSPAHTKIMAELDKRGLDESYLAQKYADAIKESKTAKGRVGDYNAHAKLLFQLGILMGYGKPTTPGVAVQINTGSGPNQEFDPGTGRELLERVASICEALEKRISEGQLPSVHEGNPGDANAGAHT